jgi:hypothetical protein
LITNVLRERGLVGIERHKAVMHSLSSLCENRIDEFVTQKGAHLTKRTLIVRVERTWIHGCR